MQRTRTTWIERVTLLSLAILLIIPVIQSNAQHRADIVDTAVAAGSFNTLAAALDAAGLVGTLKEANSLTVFAPTDEAFAKLPSGTVESLLKPENKDQLISILTYHVAKGRLRAEEVADLRTAETLNGQRIDITIGDGRLKLNESTVQATDIRASNGIIHVIDEVLIPETRTIPEIAGDAGSFRTLLAAVQEAGLTDALLGDGPFTVFAPTDEAFGNLPSGTVESLLKPENREQLQRILKYHVVQGRLYTDDFFKTRNIRTLAESRVRLSFADGAFRINTSEAVATNIDAANGVIHVIDRVLLPESMSSASAAASNIMQLAIEKGVPLFNAGQEAACVAVYQVAAESVLALNNVSEDAKKPLRKALERIRTTHSANRQAWMLREGLDQSLNILETSGLMATN